MVELAEEWRSIVKGAVQRGEVGGVSLLFIKDGKEICWLGEGYADRENKREIKRDTIFRLYSMTKPVTAVDARRYDTRPREDAPLYVGKFVTGKKP